MMRKEMHKRSSMKRADNPEEFQMDLMDHLRELRKRLFVSLIAVTLGAIGAYYYATPVFNLLEAPYFDVFPKHSLIATSPAEGFVIKLKVACFAGALLVSPILFYQLWLFINPGLYDNERKMMIPFVLCSTVLFIGGAYFCYHYVLPYTLTFFRDEIESIGAAATIKIGEYLSLAITTLLGFGAVFELPLLTYFLARAGVIDHRFLITWMRHAVLVIFVVSAILTPPDVLTQFLMAGPLFILYCISTLIAWWVAPRLDEVEGDGADSTTPTPPDTV
jgi:sec-independent protein translocase protein TatC